jgi:hypothetical protein
MCKNCQGDTCSDRMKNRRTESTFYFVWDSKWIYADLIGMYKENSER